jgi:hypothetical protein
MAFQDRKASTTPVPRFSKDFIASLALRHRIVLRHATGNQPSLARSPQRVSGISAEGNVACNKQRSRLTSLPERQRPTTPRGRILICFTVKLLSVSRTTVDDNRRSSGLLYTNWKWRIARHLFTTDSVSHRRAFMYSLIQPCFITGPSIHLTGSFSLTLSDTRSVEHDHEVYSNEPSSMSRKVRAAILRVLLHKLSLSKERNKGFEDCSP